MKIDVGFLDQIVVIQCTFPLLYTVKLFQNVKGD